MSRLLTAALLVLGLLLGGLSWSLAETGRSGRLWFGVLPVAGSLVILIALAGCRERDRLPPMAGAARSLVYALVVAAIAHVLLFSPFDPARAALVLHLGVASGAGALLWRARRAPGAPALPLLLELVLAAILIVVVGAEATLRVYAAIEPRALFLQRDMPPGLRIACVDAKPGSVIDGQTVNADGFVDRPFEHIEGQRTALVLGDAALALGVPTPWSATRIAEAASPGITFWNATLPRTSLPESHHLLVGLGLGLRPDAIVAVINLGDDLDELQRTAPPWDAAALWLDRENVLLNVVIARSLERRAQLPQLREFDATAITEELTDPAAILARMPWLADPTLEPPRATADQLVARSQRSLDVNQRATRAGLVATAIATVIAMRDRAVAAGLKFGVVVLPARYQVDLELWDLVRRRVRNADRDAPRPELLQGLRANDIPMLDLGPVLATAQPHADGRSQLFHRGDVVLNARGGRLAGEALGGFVRGLLGPVPGGGR